MASGTAAASTHQLDSQRRLFTQVVNGSDADKDLSQSSMTAFRNARSRARSVGGPSGLRQPFARGNGRLWISAIYGGMKMFRSGKDENAFEADQAYEPQPQV